MKEKRVGIFVNPAAREKYKKKAVSLKERIPGSSVYELKFPMLEFPKDLTTAVGIGGDGSMNGLINELLKKEDGEALCTLVVVPAGSMNGFYRSLVDDRLTVTVDDLQKGEIELPLCRPGRVNDLDFGHFAGFGDLEVGQALEIAELRKKGLPLTRELQNYLAVFVSFVKHLPIEEDSAYVLRFATISRRAGNIYLPCVQQLCDEKLTLFSLRGERSVKTFVKLALLFGFSLIRKKFPEKLVKVEQAEVHKIEDPQSKISRVNLDGEVAPLAHEGTIFIARGQKAIQAGALILDDRFIHKS